MAKNVWIFLGYLSIETVKEKIVKKIFLNCLPQMNPVKTTVYRGFKPAGRETLRRRMTLQKVILVIDQNEIFMNGTITISTKSP